MTDDDDDDDDVDEDGRDIWIRKRKNTWRWAL